MSNRYVLRWSQIGSRRNEHVGLESFSRGQMADLLCMAEMLLEQGFTVSITPPARNTLPIVDVSLCDI